MNEAHRDTILLLFHKSFDNTDGQINYVKSIVSALKSEYRILIPSNEFYNKFLLHKKKWIFRVLFLNILLSKYIVKDRVKLKHRLKFVIIEDKYLLLPAYVSHIFLKMPEVYRVSDWGMDYAKSLDFNVPLLKSLYLAFSFLYEITVKKCSMAVIIPSEQLINEMPSVMASSIAVFPYIPSISNSNLSTLRNKFKEAPLDNSIICMFMGNFEYGPNIDAARFIIDKVAPAVLELDSGIKFLIVGNRSDEKFTERPGTNVLCKGFVDDITSLLNQCHIGLNTSVAHGGTSIKVIDYLVNGLMVVSTTEAAKGVIKSGLVNITSRENFPKAIVSAARKIRESNGIDLMEVERIREYYSLERNAENLTSFLKSI